MVTFMGNNVKQFRIIVLKIRKKDRFLKKADPHGYGYMESFTERDPGSFVVFPVDFLQYGKYFWVSCISSSVFPKNRKEKFPILGMGYSHISAGNIFI